MATTSSSKQTTNNKHQNLPQGMRALLLSTLLFLAAGVECFVGVGKASVLAAAGGSAMRAAPAGAKDTGHAPPSHPPRGEGGEGLYVETPLLLSRPLSELTGCRVYLKLEALQPSGSFKDRGMTRLCCSLKERGVTRLISSSGGNAGHSVSHVGRLLDLSVLVVVPVTTKPIMLDLIRAQGAEVRVHGENWNAADALARELVEADPLAAAYISPYDNPLLWEGHSSMVDEILRQGQDMGLGRPGKGAAFTPGAVIASVGGGGLLCGLFEGLSRHQSTTATTFVIAAETEGAASFARGLEAASPVRLKSIDSLATSLGALEVTPVAIERAQQQPTESVTVTDREAVLACAAFLEQHRILVEPACGAALAVAYSAARRGCLERFKDSDGVVIVVCGGSGVSKELLELWLQQVSGAGDGGVSN